jgi:hypothetical protein
MKPSSIILIKWGGMSLAEKKSRPKLQKPWRQIVKTDIHSIQFITNVRM